MTLILTIISLIVTAAVVLVLVVYLLGIIFALVRGQASLARLAGHLSKVRDDTEPLPAHFETINSALPELLRGLLQVNNNLGAIVEVAKSAISKNPQSGGGAA